MSEMCCTWLAENTGCKNYARNRHLGTITQLCRAISSQLRHVSAIGKELVKPRYLLHMSSQYSELWPINGWNLLASLGHLSKFQWVSRFGFITAATSLSGSYPNFALCPAISWHGIVYIHFQQLLPPDGILPRAQFTVSIYTPSHKFVGLYLRN